MTDARDSARLPADRVAPALVVLGASGFVGHHVVAAAASSWRAPVLAVTRQPDARLPAAAVPIVSDVRAVGDLSSRVPAQSLIVNLIYAREAVPLDNLAIADAVADLAIRSEAAAVVHVSTADVVGRCRDREVTEETACRPVTAYQQTKLAIEDALRRRLTGQCALVTLRPTAVFGRGGLGLRKLVLDLTRRPAYENYLRACVFGRRPMHLVPVETVTQAILFVAGRVTAASHDLYLVGADEAPANTFPDVERAIRAGLGLRARFPSPVYLPPAVLETALRMSGRQPLALTARFRSDKLHGAGFVPPLTFEAALLAYAAGARAEADGPAGSGR